MKSEQELTEFITSMAEVDRDEIAANEFRPRISFITSDDQTRLILFPRIDETWESRMKTGYAVSVLAASIDNLWAICWVLDSCHAEQMTKTDGTSWGPGEMQKALEEGGPDAALVTEAYSYQLTEVDGTTAMLSLPYDRTDEGITYRHDDIKVGMQKPKFEGESEGEGEVVLGGTFTEIFAHGIKEPKLIQAMKEQFGDHEAFGLTLENARMHTLAIGAKMVMSQTQFPCMIPAYSQEEAELLERSMTTGPLASGGRIYSEDDLNEIGELQKDFEQPAHEKE